MQYAYCLTVQTCGYNLKLLAFSCVSADSAEHLNSSAQIPTTSTSSCDIFCHKYAINLFFKSPFLAVWVCLCVVLSPVWKVWSLAFILATCQEWVPSVYQTKTVSCHLLKSQIHHPKISWSLSSTGNWHMRMKTAFYSEIIRQGCQSRRKMMCES